MFEPIALNGISEEVLDFHVMQKKHFVDVNKSIKRQPVALSIGTHGYGDYTYPIPFGSYGDFSCIVGASKSMKTYFKTALIAGYIGGKSTNYFINFKGHDTQEKFILDIDTEQSIFHAHRASKRVLEMVGADYEYYKPFALRGEIPRIRLEFIEWLIMESEYRNNIGLVTIDGAADLIDNVNDLEGSNKLAQAYMSWTTSANCHLITVLHRNFGSAKPTGHLGSAILKKAETVAFVEKDGDTVKVTPEYTRNYPFAEFTFSLNDRYLPFQTENHLF